MHENKMQKKGKMYEKNEWKKDCMKIKREKVNEKFKERVHGNKNEKEMKK